MATSVKDFLLENSIYAGPKGARPDSDEAYSFLNRARKKLYEQADYQGTIIIGPVLLNSNCFVPPFEVEAIRAVYMNTAPFDIKTSHFTTSEPSAMAMYCGSKLMFAATGRIIPFISSYKPSSFKIGFSAADANDAGAKVCVKFKETCGSIGSAEIELSDNWEETCIAEAIATSIIGLSKPITYGRVNVHLNGCIVYSMHPYETASQYNEYYVNQCDPNCCVIIRGKKRFIPYSKTKDTAAILDLSCDSVAFAMQAVTAQEQGDAANYAQMLKLARDHAELDQENFQTTTTPSVASMKDTGAYSINRY